MVQETLKKTGEMVDYAKEKAAEAIKETAEELKARAEKLADRAEVKEAAAAATEAMSKAGKAAMAAAEVMTTPSEKNVKVITPEMAKIPAGHGPTTRTTRNSSTPPTSVNWK